MKISNNSSFPYPVLGIRNDIQPGLPDDALVMYETTSGTYDYGFIIKLHFENPYIQSLIDDGKAIFTCMADCAKTSYNKCFTSKTPQLEITIPRRSVYGRVNLQVYVTAVEEIPDYDNPGKHEDFDGFKFNIEPGEILVAFPPAKIDTDLRSDVLHVAGTYMEIREDDKATEPYHMLQANKIGIVLPSNMFRVYKSKIGEQNVQIIHSSLAFNALMYALFNLDDYRDSEWLWARCIIARLEEDEKFAPYREKIEKSDIPIVAQMILDNPYARLFSFIETSNVEQEY